MDQNQEQQTTPAQATQNKPITENKRIMAGVLAILLGAFGVHKFILGYKNEGIIMLVVSLVGGTFTCGMTSIAVSILGLVEGIIYLTKSDEEFNKIYVEGRKAWL